MKRTVETTYYKAVRLLADFIPAAKREMNRMLAIDAFNLASNGGFARIAADIANIARDRLADAGYDIDTDTPYREVFGLEGGKAEFDTTFARKPGAITDGPVCLGPK
jgi:hypothetical protein